MTAAPSRRSRPPVKAERLAGAARPGGAVAQTALAHAAHADPVIPVAPVEPAPKHLRVAPKVSRKVLRQRRRARYAVAGVAALSAASMFLLVTFHVWAAQSSFQLDKLETQQAAAQRENEFLRNEVASRSSATEIAKEAADLHLVQAPNVILLPLLNGGGGGTAAAFSTVALPPPFLPKTPYQDLAAGP
jgi:hypothetical protein